MNRNTIFVLLQVSDANTELVKLGNQVALLEDEKGNLQLSLVDFDELKGRNLGGLFLYRHFPSSRFVSNLPFCRIAHVYIISGKSFVKSWFFFLLKFLNTNSRFHFNIEMKIHRV
jgi:hypothetical protein